MAKELTPTEYADLAGYTPQHIHKLLKDGIKLKHVKNVKRYGRFYVLEVPDNLSKESFKKKVA